MAQTTMSAAALTRPVQRISRSSGFRRTAAFTSGPSRRTGMKIQAVLAADAAVDVSKMAPLGDRLLVKPKEQEEKTSGGILLASHSAPRMEDALVGTVLAVGEDVDVGVVTGDMVLFTKYGSSDIEVPGGDVCFVAQKSILAKLA